MTVYSVCVSQLNGSTVGDVHIKVSIARKQPMLDAATGKSVWASLGKLHTLNTSHSWIRLWSLQEKAHHCLFVSFSLSTAVQNSTKGSYRDKRNQVVYSEDFLWCFIFCFFFKYSAFDVFVFEYSCCGIIHEKCVFLLNKSIFCHFDWCCHGLQMRKNWRIL